MKFETSCETIEVSGALKTGQFGMSVNAKAFKVLGDGIYSDKPLAIMREISANAVDSHQKSGKSDIPIKVHLPSKEELYFSVEDKGVSISPKQFDEIYTQFFESDKDDDNDAIGCFGLGAKVPICYHTQTFTVTTWLSGVHRIYSCYIDNGIPCFAQLCEEDTDHNDGVLISIPVDENDINRFYTKVNFVYRYYKVKPKFVGEKNNPFIETFTPLLEAKDKSWQVVDNSYTAKVIMGGVSYDININDTSFDSRQQLLLNKGVFLYAELGEVEPNSSRDGLSYSKKTIEFIKNKLDDIILDATSMVVKKINNCKNMWEAKVFINDISGNLDSLRDIVDNKLITWRGRKICNGFLVSMVDFSKMEEVEVLKYKYVSYRDSVGREKVNSICPSNKIKLVYGDIVGSKSRCVLLERNDRCVVFHITCKVKDLPHFINILGCNKSDIIMARDLPKPDRKSSLFI
jgi:hypothetical protein